MKKKPLDGVRIFSILLILGGLYQLLMHHVFDFIVYNIYDQLGLELKIGTLAILCSLHELIVFVLFIVGIIAGIGTWQLKEYGRKLALFIGFYSIVDLYFVKLYIFKNADTVFRYYNPIMSFLDYFAFEEALTIFYWLELFCKTRLGEDVVSALWYVILPVAFCVIKYSFPLCLIFFFTRPKVKEQFR